MKWAAAGIEDQWITLPRWEYAVLHARLICNGNTGNNSPYAQSKVYFSVRPKSSTQWEVRLEGHITKGMGTGLFLGYQEFTAPAVECSVGGSWETYTTGSRLSLLTITGYVVAIEFSITDGLCKIRPYSDMPSLRAGLYVRLADMVF